MSVGHGDVCADGDVFKPLFVGECFPAYLRSKTLSRSELKEFSTASSLPKTKSSLNSI